MKKEFLRVIGDPKKLIHSKNEIYGYKYAEFHKLFVLNFCEKTKRKMF